MSATPSMRCDEAVVYLSALTDNELAEPLRSVVAAHVAGCTVCTVRVERYRRLDAMVATLPGSSPSPEVVDRVMAGVTRRSATPAIRESLRRPNKRLLPRTLPAFLSAFGADIGAPPVPTTLRRSFWLTGVLPALAAVLLISMTFVAFHRVPQVGQRQATGQTATASGVYGSTLQQTRDDVKGYVAQLAFTPVLPTYLPPQARLVSVTVGPDHVGVNSHYLDIVWELPAPVGLIHLREAPIPLAERIDCELKTNPIQLLSWQVDSNPWRPITCQAAPQRWAVGEDRGKFSITLDADEHGDTGSLASQVDSTKVNVLRLVSLSMDSTYQSLSVLPPDTSGTILHYQAQANTSRGPVTWNVYVNPSQHTWRAMVTSGASEYTDIGDGTRVARLDPGSRTFAYLTPADASDPINLRYDVTTFFLTANTFLRDGELWNMGEATFDSMPAYRLALVNAPYPTSIYVDRSSHRIIGVTVEYASSIRPGGPQATSRFTPTTGCPSYALIEYLSPHAVNAQTFAMTPQPGYRAGLVPSTIPCG